MVPVQCPPARDWAAVYPALFELQAVHNEFNAILQDPPNAWWIQEQFEHWTQFHT